MSYEEALAAGAAGIGRRVLIVDELGDRIAPGLAELLATEGKQVEVVTRWVNLYHMWGVYWNELAWVYGKLDELGVKVVPCAWVKNIDGSKVTCFNVFSSREWETTADTVILVTMKYSNMDVYRLFKAKGVKPVYLIGDAKAPRHIGDAIRDGHAAAREIGGNRAEVVSETREVWAFLEASEGLAGETAPKIAFEAQRVARLVGARACSVVAEQPEGSDPPPLAPVDRLYRVRGEPWGRWTPEALAHALVSLACQYEPYAILFAGTALGAEVASRVAARLGRGLASRCVDFERRGEDLVARRPVAGGRFHATVRWTTAPPYLATVDPEALELPDRESSGPGEVVEARVSLPPSRTRLLRRWELPPGDIDLTEARFVLGIGKPIVSRPEWLPRIQEIARRLGAALGASRIVVDAGLIPKARQIGASGKWLGSDVYLACGISGSSYHMMGVKGVKHLVAVNIDRGAPIFQAAELGVVGDLFEILPALARHYESALGGSTQGGSF
jgi:electron transfer flavoprotein alpha subunit